MEIESEDQGINPVYKFLNKATGEYLFITMQDFSSLADNTSSSSPVKVCGEIYQWKFSDAYNNDYLNKEIPLYAFYKASNVVGLNINSNGEVRVVKTPVNSDNSVPSDVPGINGTLSQFTLQTSRTLKYLSAEEFNTVIGNQEEDEGVALVFEEDMSVNPFTGKKYLQKQRLSIILMDQSQLQTTMLIYIFVRRIICF